MPNFLLTDAQRSNIEIAGHVLGYHASFVPELGYYVIGHNGERIGAAETFNEAMSLIALELPVDETE